MKDKRYSAVRSLIKANEIKQFADIFDILPITVVSKDTGTNYNTLYRRVHNPNLLTMDNLLALATAFEIDIMELMPVIVKSLKAKKSGGSKTK
ncbi:helix-turn-helix domain-containing protein [Chitinophaga sp.]|uniref:helix-turn-helix domain-containing protein n=1 Tax=Chitinophaga sp. TaxID=1869181 RepID=UPI0031D5F06B